MQLTLWNGIFPLNKTYDNTRYNLLSKIWITGTCIARVPWNQNALSWVDIVVFRLPKLGHSRAGTPLYLKSLDPDKCRNFSHQHFIERLRKLRGPNKPSLGSIFPSCHEECHFTWHCHFSVFLSCEMTLFVTVEKWTLRDTWQYTHPKVRRF